MCRLWLSLRLFLLRKTTSRDRPKSAPYPRLKNSKKTSKCQVFSFTVLENRIFYEKKIRKNTYSKNGPSGAPGPASASPWRAERGDTSEIVNICVAVEGVLSQNIKKLKRGKFFIFGKNLSAEKKLKGGTLWDFPTSILSQNSKKIEEGTLWGKKIRKKVSQCRKKLEGGTLWSPRVWYGTRENRKNLFSSVR